MDDKPPPKDPVPPAAATAPRGTDSMPAMGARTIGSRP